MPNLNKCLFAGHLGKDPETKTFANGGSVCQFSMAVTEKWKGKDGNPGEHTEWLNIVCHGKTGELAQKYLKKGAAVMVEGKLKTRSYEKDGQKRYVSEIHVDQLHFLGKGEAKQESRPEPAGAATGGMIDEEIPFRSLRRNEL